MKAYTVKYEHDNGGWWVASAIGLKGCHTQGRSIDEARRRIREAIAACLDLTAKNKARLEIHDAIKVPAATKRLLAKLAKARAKEEAASTAARKAAGRAVRELTERMNLSRRDAAALTGYSFQRIQQLARQR